MKAEGCFRFRPVLKVDGFGEVSGQFFTGWILIMKGSSAISTSQFIRLSI